MSLLEYQPTQTLNPFNLPRLSRAAIVLAHPDDEVLNIALFKELEHQGAEVSVFVATNGEASTKGDPEFVASGGREHEMRRSLDRLNIKKHNRRQLKLPDFNLQDPDIQAELRDEITDFAYQQGTDVFFVVGDAGLPHPDHQSVFDTTIAVANELQAAGIDVRAWELSKLGAGDVYLPFNAGLKEPHIDIHRSQFGKPEHRAELAQYGAAMTFMETYREVQLLGGIALCQSLGSSGCVHVEN